MQSFFPDKNSDIVYLDRDKINFVPKQKSWNRLPNATGVFNTLDLKGILTNSIIEKNPMIPRAAGTIGQILSYTKTTIGLLWFYDNLFGSPSE